MKTIFVILKKGESEMFESYQGITNEITDELIEKYTGYKSEDVSKIETDEGIYAGYVGNDYDEIAEFNSYFTKGDYSTAYYNTYGAVFFKKESIKC